MNLRSVGFFVLGLLVARSAFQPAPALEPADAAVERIVRSIDGLYRGASSRALVEMSIETPRWRRRLSMVVETLGETDTFIRIKDPAKEKGTGTLRHGEEIWNYLPRAGEVVRIPPSLLMNAWMGSDFTNDDLVKQYTFFRDHVCTRTTVPAPQEHDIHIRCEPKPEVSVLWHHVLLVADETSALPLRQEFYDRNDKLIRSLVYSEVTTIRGRKLPTVLDMIPASGTKQHTTIRYKDLEFDVKLPEEVFSRRHLQSTED